MKKRLKVLVIVMIAFVCALTTGCGKKINYDEYIGYQFSGKNPWDNELAITIRTIEDNKITWTYTDILGDDDDAVMLYNEVSSEIKDGVVKYTVKGNTDVPNVTFEYTGTLTLKDGDIIVKYEKGQVTSNSSEGGSGSFHAESLNEKNRTVTLTRVEDDN